MRRSDYESGKVASSLCNVKYIALLREKRVHTRPRLSIIQHELNFLAFQPDGEQPLNLHDVEWIAVPGHADAHREVIPGIDERGEEYEGSAPFKEPPWVLHRDLVDVLV